MFINLKEFYPFYSHDEPVEVPDEVGKVLLESKQAEKNYLARLSYHKAYYSLDLDDGIESAAIHQLPTPEKICLDKFDKAQLYAAFATLPDKQAKRLYAFFFLNMSKSEIAKAEGVNKSQVSRSIGAALEKLALDLKNSL